MASKIVAKVTDAQDAFKSKGSLKEYLQTPGHQANDGKVATYNDDLLPTPPGMSTQQASRYIFVLIWRQNSEHGLLSTTSLSI